MSALTHVAERAQRLARRHLVLAGRGTAQGERPSGLLDMSRVAAVAALTPTAGVGLVLLIDPRLFAQLSGGPVMLAMSAAGATLCAYLLRILIATLGEARLRWMPFVFLVAAAISVVRGFAPGVEASADSGHSSPNVAALISTVQVIAIAGFALFALRARARRLTWVLALAWVAATAALVVVAARGGQAYPVLIARDGRLTDLAHVVLVLVALWAFGATAIWLRAVGVRPLAPEAWIGVALAFNALAVPAFAVATREEDTLWWVSVGLGAARFVIPGVGLLVALAALYRALADYDRELEQRVLGLIDTRNSDAEIEPVSADCLRAALEPGGLRMVFQPIVDLNSGDVTGLEALARPSSNPSLGAGPLFAAAHEAGRSTELEVAALRAAVDHLPDVPEEHFLAINASPSLLSDPEFSRALAHLPLDRVVVEVTEREAIFDFDRVDRPLQPLRDRGLRLAIDDTGSGYAGMRHIVGLRPDIIKLDAELLHELDADTTRAELVRALASFGRAIGAMLIAEGIEHEDALKHITTLGVSYAQGYLLGRPTQLSDALELSGSAAAGHASSMTPEHVA